MIKTIKDLIKSKRQLRDIQKVFEKKLNETYPYLQNKDSSILFNDINRELDILLSSSVLYKTGIIKIKVDNISWYKELKLSRAFGLKAPYRSYSTVRFIEVKTILLDGTIKLKEERDKEEGRIELGILRNNRKIKQNKLEKFYSFLEELLRIQEPLKKIIHSKEHSTNYGEKDLEFHVKIGRYSILVLKKGFDILVEPLDKQNKETFNSFQMKDYEEEDINWSSKLALNLQEELVNEYPKIHNSLLKLDKEKKLSMEKLEKYLEKLKEENKAFMIFQKLY